MNPWIKNKGEKYLRGWDPAGNNCLGWHICAVDPVQFYRTQKVFYPTLWEVLYPASTQENFSVLLLVLDERNHTITVAGPCGKTWHKG